MNCPLSSISREHETKFFLLGRVRGIGGGGVGAEGSGGWGGGGDGIGSGGGGGVVTVPFIWFVG